MSARASRSFFSAAFTAAASFAAAAASKTLSAAVSSSSSSDDVSDDVLLSDEESMDGCFGLSDVFLLASRLPLPRGLPLLPLLPLLLTLLLLAFFARFFAGSSFFRVFFEGFFRLLPVYSVLFRCFPPAGLATSPRAGRCCKERQKR